jgi:hypothetical protein
MRTEQYLAKVDTLGDVWVRFTKGEPLADREGSFGSVEVEGGGGSKLHPFTTFHFTGKRRARQS